MTGKPLSFSISLCLLCGDARSHLVKSLLVEAAIEKYAAFFTPLTKCENSENFFKSENHFVQTSFRSLENMLLFFYGDIFSKKFVKFGSDSKVAQDR